MTPCSHTTSLAAALLAALLLLAAFAVPPVGAQPPPTPTAAPAPTVAPPSPTVAPPTPTTASLTQTPALPLTPTTGPMPEPTLTIPEAIDRIASGEQLVETLVTLLAQRPPLLIVGLIALALLIAGVVAAVKPWRERLLRLVDQTTGGERIDIEHEVQREAKKKEVAAAREAEKTQQQMRAALASGIESYLTWLQAEYGSTQPLGIATEQVQLSLEAVHVPLRVVERDTIDAYRRRMRGEQEREQIRRETPDRVSSQVFELLSEPDLLAAGAPDDDADPSMTTKRLLLLGDAGSGKTMTLRYAALRLAQAYRTGDAALLADRTTGLALRLRRPPLPIYVRLTLFAASIPADLSELPVQERERYAGAPPALFLGWLDREAAKYCELPDGALSALVKKNDGGVLLLLDGLDEAGDDQRRAYLAELIGNLAGRYANQRYVVASRTAGYRGRIHLAEFLERHLSPLDAEEAQALLRKWFDAVYTRLAAIGRRRQDAAADQAAQLWGAIERNERLFEMATNPLLLTAMALLQFNSVKLPDQRAKLYEKLIELLLDLWRKQNVANDTLVMSVAQLATEQRRIEAEWERAAAYPPILPGGKTRAGRREYPWGAWPDVTKTTVHRINTSIPANTDESKIDGTSAVGIFPHGAAACGAQDLAGNVWEWCSTPKLAYPFKGEVSAESIYTENKRASSTYVLRVGSWAHNRDYARCAYRRVLPPDYDLGNNGFRLARLFSLSSP